MRKKATTDFDFHLHLTHRGRWLATDAKMGRIKKSSEINGIRQEFVINMTSFTCQNWWTATTIQVVRTVAQQFRID